MTGRRYPRDRKARESRKAARPRPPTPVRRSPYGDIPLLKVVSIGIDGRRHEWWRPDPDYEPPLPRGAVRGDVRLQVFCTACHHPKYFYVDEVRRCMQCSDSFTFAAAEQKYWYEALKFNFYSVAVRCARCRKQRRTERALHRAVAAARSAVEAAPDDPAAHLSLARALVGLHERTGAGKLDEVIAAARRAAALWPESPEPRFWEGKAHLLAGRSRKGRQCLAAFLEAAESASITAGLVPEGRRKLEE